MSLIQTSDTADKIFQQMRKGNPDCQHGISSRIYKYSGEPGDITPLGTPGTVVGSDIVEGQEVYLVHFDVMPDGTYVFIMGFKIRTL